MSLNDFLSQYKNEDHASFTKIMEKEKKEIDK